MSATSPNVSHLRCICTFKKKTKKKKHTDVNERCKSITVVAMVLYKIMANQCVYSGETVIIQACWNNKKAFFPCIKDTLCWKKNHKRNVMCLYFWEWRKNYESGIYFNVNWIRYVKVFSFWGIGCHRSDQEVFVASKLGLDYGICGPACQV